ncbi:MAG: hypothetical protein JWP29_857 [Rhodoferax sp.]|nr:hypothetical protein [Rhodoferax sp.]
MRLNVDSFLVSDDQAIDVADAHFGGLLQPERSDRITPLQIVNPHSIEFRIRELDGWFDALRPHFVDVKIFPGESLGQEALRATVSNGGLPNKLRKSGSKRISGSLAQVLAVLWKFLRDTIVDLHDLQCWVAFAARYREAFFALDAAKGFFIRYRYDDAGYAMRCQPPASLAGLLPDFHVALPQATPDAVDQTRAVDSGGVVAAHHPEEEFYGLSRLTPHSGSARWVVVLGRGESAVRRRFSDSVYGDNAAALLMARTYRDAALQLCPSHPVIRLQKRDAESERRLQILDAWFDALAPRFVNVYMYLEVSSSKGRMLRLGASGGVPPATQVVWQCRLSQRSWQDALQLAWPKLQQGLMQLHGEDCWNEFSAKYKTSFFATQAFERLEVRYRTAPGFDAGLRRPPPELAQWLSGFSVPLLPPCEPYVNVSMAAPTPHGDIGNGALALQDGV